MPNNMSVHYSSNSNEWETPQWLFDRLNDEFHFTLDPCATADNAKCEKYYTKKDNGLAKNWTNEVVFMNPPYGREIIRWMEKAYRESMNGATVVCLVPARTDTKWWHEYAMRGEIGFIRGRIRFLSNGKIGYPAPFPSAIVVLRDCRTKNPRALTKEQWGRVCAESSVFRSVVYWEIVKENEERIKNEPIREKRARADKGSKAESF